MNLWLDDIRPPPDGWHWVRTAEESVAWILTGSVERASLDHDLGRGLCRRERREVSTGYEVVRWLEEHPEYWPPYGVEVHSQNPPSAPRLPRGAGPDALADFLAEQIREAE